MPAPSKTCPRAWREAKKTLIVTDHGLVKAGILDQITTVLKEADLPYAVYDGTPPDPPVECVEEAAELYKGQGCDSVLALGGGSPIDAAKGVIVQGEPRRRSVWTIPRERPMRIPCPFWWLCPPPPAPDPR